MKQVFFFVLVMMQLVIFSQETIFFDKNWDETSKEAASYYRKIEKKGGLYLIKDFYITGELQFEGYAFNDRDPLDLDGVVTWYHQNGKISEKRGFSKHIPVGEVTAYYSNGVLKLKGNYKYGQFDGLYTQYFPSGNIANQGTFINGVVDGTHTKYKADNELEFKVTYKMGALDGPYEFYNNSGHLFNRGNAKNNFQEGKCYDYFYEGQLRKEYVVRNKKLDGWLYEYSQQGDTVGQGEFKDGVPLSYKMVSHGITNGSKFSAEMQLVNGIENWKIYRDSVLVVKSFYKNGTKYGVWQVYTFDGKSLFQNRVYENNSTCSDKYLQTVRDKFDPFFFLSDRFKFGNEVLEDDDCTVNIEQLPADKDEHPFFHYTYTKTSKPEKKSNADIVEYTDPTRKNDFPKKNNCVDFYKEYKDVSVCTREINNITYKVFISENLSRLKGLKMFAQPLDNEVYFYYQQFRNRTYDFSKEPRPERYMGFTLPQVLKEALNEGKFSKSVISRVLEHDFWNIDDFSGFASDDALERELK